MLGHLGITALNAYVDLMLFHASYWSARCDDGQGFIEPCFASPPNTIYMPRFNRRLDLQTPREAYSRASYAEFSPLDAAQLYFTIEIVITARVLPAFSLDIFSMPLPDEMCWAETPIAAQRCMNSLAARLSSLHSPPDYDAHEPHGLYTIHAHIIHILRHQYPRFRHLSGIARL